ncbi:hypothetical protein BD289DRAFT_445109 [Coniella lustricola]|uniref:Uncharacterized protein n=1 Tax=Coniella lustricola TaxID=2025994 RepID=A0A2T2ZV82_9PEZI|nr:hypothetical protein BD289DRAFT_445109 [Coniella lustricola]
MSFDAGGQSRLRRRASVRSQLPSFAAAATAHSLLEKPRDYAQSEFGTTKASNTRDVPAPRAPAATKGSSLLDKKADLSSDSDFPPAAIEGSRISRLPTRASTARPARKPLDLDECFKLARERMARDIPPGSPSPAPRPRPQTNGASSQQTTPSMLFTHKPIVMGHRGPKPARLESALEPRVANFRLPAHHDEESDEEFADRMHQFEQDAKQLEAMKEKKSWTKRSEPISLIRKTSASGAGGGKLDTSILGNQKNGAQRHDWGKPGAYSTVLRKFSSDPDAARAFNERFGSGLSHEQRLGSRSGQQSAITRKLRSKTPPPAKGDYSFEVDNDFTDEDLQISTSPPVGYRRTNTKIDEIRELERNYSLGGKQNLFPERTNTRLEETRRRELEDTTKAPHVLEPKEPILSLSTDPHSLTSESEAKHIQKVEELARRVANKSRLDLNGKRRSFLFTKSELEADAAVSQKATLLDSLKPLPRTISPDDVKPEESQTGHSTAFPTASKMSDGADGQSLTGTNKGSQHRPGPEPVPSIEPSRNAFTRSFRRNPRFSALQDRKNESKESAPAKERIDQADKVKPDTKVDADLSTLPRHKRETSLSKARIELPDLARTTSATSVASKTSADSWDPTDRIQAEAKLFALGNESERGSLRAPSPVSAKPNHGETDNEETPRPKRADTLVMPTPVVTGAFVDSPAVDKIVQRGRQPLRNSSSDTNGSMARSLSVSPRPNQTEKQHQPRAHPSSDMNPRRTRSTPRRRSPLRNSIRPPTVKDDLRDILKKSHVEGDSTLDDFTALTIADPSEPTDASKDKSNGSADPSSKDEQMKRLNGMSDALKTGLAGIRTARKGIERLEDQISYPPKTQTRAAEARRAARIQRLAQLQGDSYTLNLSDLPIPRLYQTKPRIRPTLLGLLVLLLSLWHIYWVMEGVFYDKWGKQKICYRGSPCRWDVDDPDYGYTIPVKLDQWVTGGLIRPHAAQLLQEAQDGWADVEDWWTGIDLRTVNHQAIRDPIKKQQYWRRLEKKGFLPEWRPDPWMQPQFEMWELEAQKQEASKARAALEYHDNYDDDEDGNEKSADHDDSVDQRRDDQGRENRVEEERVADEAPARPATHGYVNAWWQNNN